DRARQRERQGGDEDRRPVRRNEAGAAHRVRGSECLAGIARHTFTSIRFPRTFSLAGTHSPGILQAGSSSRPWSCPMKWTRACLLLILVLFATNPSAEAGPPIPSPREHFGFNMGDDYCLANYKQLAAYWAKLERESDRFKAVRIGTTAEGR